MRRTAGLLSIAAVTVSAAPAAAAPPGHGLTSEPFTCSGLGETTVVHPQGANAYIGDQHYVVASFTFTPTGGAPQTQTLGRKAGLSGAVTCSHATPAGTFTAVLVPVPPGS